MQDPNPRVAGDGLRKLEAVGIITAVGILSRPSLPDIPGLDTFKGRIVHSAVWPKDLDLAGKRVAMVGTDCALGKKYTALALARAMRGQGVDADFRATGQTGIMIAGAGIAVDAVIADFIAGAAECISPDAAPDHWDLIEGQGSLFHPAYAGVTLGLLHGSQADGLVLCHDPLRTHLVSWPDYPVPGLAAARDLPRAQQAAQATAAENGGSDLRVVTTTGTYVPDAAVAPTAIIHIGASFVFSVTSAVSAISPSAPRRWAGSPMKGSASSQPVAKVRPTVTGASPAVKARTSGVLRRVAPQRLTPSESSVDGSRMPSSAAAAPARPATWKPSTGTNNTLGPGAAWASAIAVVKSASPCQPRSTTR